MHSTLIYNTNCTWKISQRIDTSLRSKRSNYKDPQINISLDFAQRKIVPRVELLHVAWVKGDKYKV